jgi:hypothetical protein
MAYVLRKLIPEPVAQFPILREINPDIARMQDKITDLNLLAAAKQAEIAAINRQIVARRGTTHSTGRGAAVSANVHALLGDVAPAAPASPPVASLEERSIALNAEIGDIRAAIATLEQPLRDATMRASWRMCEAVRPEYEALVGRLHAATVALTDALADHSRFLDSFQEQGAGLLDVLPAHQITDTLDTLRRQAATRLGN